MLPDTAAEEGNAPALQKTDGSSSEFLPDEVRPELALEKPLDSQDTRSTPKEEKSVEDQRDLRVMKNENHENDADSKSQKECGDAISSGIENGSENLSEDSPADTTAARKEDENALASEKEESSISEIVPSEVKRESAAISDGAKESHVDTGLEEVESDGSDDLSDEVDNEG